MERQGGSMGKLRSRNVVCGIVIFLMAASSVFLSRPSQAQSAQTVYFPLIAHNAATGFGSVKGKVYSSFGNLLTNAQVCFGAANCATYDQDGFYQLDDIPSGLQALQAMADSYLANTQHAQILADQTISLYFTLAPVMDYGMRIVTTWSPTPFFMNGPDQIANNMSVHLWVPGSSPGEEQHFYYGNDGVCEGYPFACIEWDPDAADEGYGPNTALIAQDIPGIYHFAVLNEAYLQAPTVVPGFPRSGAQVQVYDASGLRETYFPPAAGEGFWWVVFDYDSLTGQIIEVNTLTDATPGVWLDHWVR
jgi:hypothetical protein